MYYLYEHRSQTILGLLQIGFIVGGSLFIRALTTSFDSTEQDTPILLYFIRNWGFLLTVIPMTWVLITVWVERNRSGYAKRYTLLSGICLTILLCWFLYEMTMKALGLLCRMGNS